MSEKEGTPADTGAPNQTASLTKASESVAETVDEEEIHQLEPRPGQVPPADLGEASSTPEDPVEGLALNGGVFESAGWTEKQGAELLDDLESYLSRFVAFPTVAARHAVVLWIAHAHAIEAFESTPRLALLSPEKGSGKTRTLEVLATVTPAPIHAVNLSAAALFRLVESQKPTLLLDEADTYLGATVAKQHEDIRGLVNAGHRRGAKAYRGEVSGTSVGVVEFSAFAPCALAGIGDLPDTILDRSVIVGMKRRTRNERVEPFRERVVRAEAEILRTRLASWGEAYTEELTEAWPEMPAGIVDRAADVWEPLVAVADAAGGGWPARAREAALTINEARQERAPSLGVQLLADCKRVFMGREADRLSTEQLVQALAELEEAPWGDLRGKPLDARGLAKRLRKYDVRPGNHRFDEQIRKGYLFEDFVDAWERYLEDEDVADTATESATAMPHNQAAVADVADVADNQSKREGLVTFEEGGIPSLYSSNGSLNGHPSRFSLSSPREALQGLQGLQAEHPVPAGCLRHTQEAAPAWCQDCQRCGWVLAEQSA